MPAGATSAIGSAGWLAGRPSEPLVVESLVKRFGGLTATDGVSFCVGAGEAVGVIGPNGAGKSTLLKLIAGIHRPTSGSIRLGGARLDGAPPHVVSRRGVAIAAQVPRPFSALTVQENVRLAASHLHRPAASGGGWGRRDRGVAAHVAAVLGACRLEHRAHARAGSLGLLDLKRLELARALATDPAILLLDEVAAGLVGEELAEVIDLIREIHGGGRSLLVVEHVQKVIHEVVQRVIVIDWGRIIAEGTPAEVAADPAVQAVYLGVADDDGEDEGGGQSAAEASREKLRSRPAGPPRPPVAPAVASAPTGPALLELERVSAGYGSLLALREVSVRIGRGQIVSVLGANGAGKSTLAGVVSGALAARGGRILLDGAAVTRLPAYRRARRGVRLCPEGRGIFAELSVEENLLLGLPQSMHRSELRQRLIRAFEVMPALESHAGQRAGSLSGGEQQMLAVARALVTESSLLICDELSLGLAPKVIDALYAVLAEVNRTGLAILLIEQNVQRALAISDHAYVLNRGELSYDGPPGPLADEDLLAEVYFRAGPPAALPAAGAPAVPAPAAAGTIRATTTSQGGAR